MNETPVAENTPKPKKSRKALKIGCGIVLVVLIGLGVWIGPVVFDFARSGILGDLLSKPEKRKYEGTSMDNLRAMHTAMIAYHDSEEMFPHGEGWMDAIEPRLNVFDMDKKESAKKLVYPEFIGQEGKFGYAMNDAAGGKYKDDIPDPDKTPLIFDSSDTKRNAHGKPEDLLPKPARGGGNRGISVSGLMLKL
jgi:hypothetical protein